MPEDNLTIFLEDGNQIITHYAILDCLHSNGELEYTAIEQQPEPGKKGILFTVWAKKIETYFIIGKLAAESMMKSNE